MNDLSIAACLCRGGTPIQRRALRHVHSEPILRYLLYLTAFLFQVKPLFK